MIPRPDSFTIGRTLAAVGKVLGSVGALCLNGFDVVRAVLKRLARVRANLFLLCLGLLLAVVRCGTWAISKIWSAINSMIAMGTDLAEDAPAQMVEMGATERFVEVIEWINAIVPLAEGLYAIVVLTGWRLVVGFYRQVKSWIPGLSGA